MSEVPPVLEPSRVHTEPFVKHTLRMKDFEIGAWEAFIFVY
jgi:hypothetical protein